MHKIAIIVLASMLGACATTAVEEQEKLAGYYGNAGEPVRQIRYRTPISWEKVDGQHLLLTLRPSEVYLLRLSGPCLDWAGSVPTIVIDNHGHNLTAGFDTIRFDSINAPAAPVSCRIEEIRPVNEG